MSKRENDSFSVKDLIQLFIKENNLKKGFQKIEVAKSWSKIMGKGVVSYTTSIELQNTTLIIRLSSSVLREELSYGKEKIIKMMNEDIGETIIKKILLI